MTKQQKQKVVDFITERDYIVEEMGNKPEYVAYLNGAIDVLKLVGVTIKYDMDSGKWVIY